MVWGVSPELAGTGLGALTYAMQALCASAAPHTDGQVRGVVGRDGASDAVSFLRVGIPAVEFGPLGAGHHGPDEWVSIPSLAGYRQAIVDFARALPAFSAPRRATSSRRQTVDRHRFGQARAGGIPRLRLRTASRGSRRR